MNEKSRQRIMLKVSYITILGNIFLSIFKLLAGIIGNSAAMISDAVHSISDVASTIIVIIGVKISNKKADKDHQYGHERIEAAMSIILAILLIVVGFDIFKSGITALFSPNPEFIIPGTIAAIAAVVSIATKEAMYGITIKASKKVNSSMLKADAWHHRSDALSSVAGLIGIMGSKLGFYSLDTIASIIISFFIFKIAIEVLKESMDKLVDKSCDEETEDKIRTLILSIDGVLALDDLKTRMFADRIYVDAEISVDGNISTTESHKIAHVVHDEVEKLSELIKHCNIHVNPV